VINLAVFATALAVILSVELPDKTLVATLVLATRYRPWPVLAGVSAAFAVQCVVAVTAGTLVTLLPERVVLAVAAALFAVGAFVVLREGVRQRQREAAEVERATGQVRNPSRVRVASISFGVLFAAEWGDASQLATVALTAHYDAVLSVFLGSFVALVAVAALAVFMGKTVLRYVPIALVHRVAGVLFAVLAVVSAYQAIHG
jgi:putative Ca2+/H+ antiporter (TMEM165/GDT1 family)